MRKHEYQLWRDAHTWDPSRDSHLVLEHDLTPAEWIGPLLVPRSYEVRMTAPLGYEAYARIFFPFFKEREVDDGLDQEYLTWTVVATRHRRIPHALMEKETISAEPGGRSKPGSILNSLSPEQEDALLPILSRNTSSSSAYFLLWEGWGDLNERVFESSTPKVRHDGRSLYLLRGPLQDYVEFPHTPNYFWPEDRSWCLCGDCDFEWMYVAGSATCVEEILAVPSLDAFATKLENPARVGMDVVNDPSANVRRG